jgi:hypothetical protein
MFKYFKEMRKLRKQKLFLETALVSKLYGFIDGMPDIVELAKKTKGLDGVEFQKMVVDMLVDWTKNKEEKSEE